MNTSEAKDTPSRGELLDAAFDVARRYVEFREYGSKEKALKALAKRRQGFSARQYSNAFEKGICLLEASIKFVEEKKELFWAQFREQEPELEFKGLDAEIRKVCSGFNLSTYRAALSWVFFWHHLK